MKQSGTTKKHAGTSKHHHHTTTHHKGHSKHNQQHQPAHEKHAHHAVQHHPHKPASSGKSPRSKKPRQSSLGLYVACCSAEALGASLRQAGREVSGTDVYNLYRLVALSDDSGVSIEDALLAAQIYGLAGVKLRAYWPVPVTAPLAVVGLELPGPHAIFSDRGCWWSWGRPYSPKDFPTAVAEEAWELRWNV